MTAAAELRTNLLARARAFAAWLRHHPNIIIVARDRGRTGPWTTRGAPQAIEVTDRWHVVENARGCFSYCRRSAPVSVVESVTLARKSHGVAACAASRCPAIDDERKSSTLLALARAGTSIKMLSNDSVLRG
jgi:hypothetical protein